MKGPVCELCQKARANVRRSCIGRPMVCSACFMFQFEEEVHQIIEAYKLFEPGDRVAIGVSGGKDSSALLHCLVNLNDRHQYGIELLMLAIDEGIKGYRNDSLNCVKLAQERYKLPLCILSFKDIYGWSMDEIVSVMGPKSNCTYCAILRRQSLDKGATILKANKLVTGHNADDAAETVLLNLLRGDIHRFLRCGDVITGKHSKMPRSKPFFFAFEREIVFYCLMAKLDYFSTECSYAPNAFRGTVREFMRTVSAEDPSVIRKILYAAHSFLNAPAAAEQQQVTSPALLPEENMCQRCGMFASRPLCQACDLIDKLNDRRMHMSVNAQENISCDDCGC